MKQLSLFSGTEHAAPDEYPDKVYIDFREFHRQNPAIYQVFKNVVFQHIYEESKEKLGARGIIEDIRFGISQLSLKKRAKINNNHVAFYSRLFRRDYPQYKGIFEIRQLKNHANEIALAEIK